MNNITKAMAMALWYIWHSKYLAQSENTPFLGVVFVVVLIVDSEYFLCMTIAH